MYVLVVYNGLLFTMLELKVGLVSMILRLVQGRLLNLRIQNTRILTLGRKN